MRLSTLLVLLLCAPAALAQDLSISASAEDSSGDPGDRVSLSYTVTLTGADEIEDVSVGFYFSTDQTLSSDDAFSEREEVDAESDEAESDNEQISVPNNLASGDYFLLVVIDDLDQVTESDETNNTVALPFTVGNGGDTGGSGGANLSVTQATVSPTSAAPGDEIEVSYVLANSGNEQAGESQIAFYFSTNQTLSSNDVLATRNEADEVDANDSGDEDEDITVPNSLAPGEYFLLVVADDRNAVTESDESDNTFAVAFTVTGSGTGGDGNADLAVTQVSATPASGDPGAEVEVGYTLTNRGSEDARESQIGFYFSTDRSLSSDDVLASREDSDGVDADDTSDDDEDITVPSSLAAGEYFILVVADDRNVVSESRESNNVGFASFTVTGGGTGGGSGSADLQASGVSVSPGAAEVGEEVQVSYTLANSGSEQAGESQVAFYFSTDRSLSSSDVLAERNDQDEVDANSTGDEDEDITVPAGLMPGEYFILVVADDQNAVAESRENNNVASVAFTVAMGTATGPLPASGVTLDAPAPNPVRDRATMSFTLQDAGPVRLSVYDARGREVAVLTDAVLAPGSHGATWTPEAAASGVYLVRLDAAGETLTQTVTVVR